MAWRKMVDDTFATDLAAKAKVKASSTRGCGYGAKCVVGEDDAYWATEDGVTTGDITLEWDEPQDVEYVTIQEHIALGQRVRSFEIDVMRDGEWQNAVVKATTVGYKRILPIEGAGVSAVRVRFTDSRGELAIARVAVY